MLRQSIRLMLTVGALFWSVPTVASIPFVYDPQTGSDVESRIVPINSVIYRVVLPDGGETMVWRSSHHTRRLAGKGRWSGYREGDRIRVFYNADAEDERDQAELYFEGGLLKELTIGGREMAYTFTGGEKPRKVQSIWPKAESKAALEKMGDVWGGDRSRFRMGYDSPNQAGACLALLALVSFGCVFLFGRRRWVAAFASVLTAVFAFGVLKTESRGAFVGLAGGVFLIVLFSYFRRFSWKKVGFVALFGAVAVLGLILSPYRARFTSGLTAVDESNEMRLDRWAAIPQMMADAPEGWGDIATGVAYGCWYQPAGKFDIRRTLVNSHAEVMVPVSWFWRGVYLFSWFVVLALGVRLAFGTGNAVPLAVWSAFAVMLFFNELLRVPTLWIVPVLTLAGFFRWELWRGRLMTGGLFAAVAGSVILCLGLHLWGCGLRQGVPIRAYGSRVTLNGGWPRIWLVQDAYVLGGWQMFARDLRAYYAQKPETPPLGIVRRVEELPDDAEVVVCCGRRAADWLEAVGKGAIPAASARKVIFLSPSIGFSALDESLRKRYNMQAIVGRLALDRSIACGEGLEVVPGAELFVPDWIERVTSF